MKLTNKNLNFMKKPFFLLSMLLSFPIITSCSTQEEMEDDIISATDESVTTDITEESTLLNDSADLDDEEVVEIQNVDDIGIGGSEPYDNGLRTNEFDEDYEDPYLATDDDMLEERGDIISDEFAMPKYEFEYDAEPFQIGSYSKINESIEYARNNFSGYENLPVEWIHYLTIISNYEEPIEIYSIELNKGLSCSLGRDIHGTITYGGKIEVTVKNCDLDQVRHVRISTDHGDVEYNQ